jgi:parallel beta-helix repeat protein
LKRVTGKIVVDWKTRANMFLDGQLDSLPVPVTGVGEVLGQPGVQSIYPLEELVCYALFFTFNISTSSPFMGVPGGLPRGTLNESGIAPDFFTDINVRKGFAYAFNYSRLITEALQGEASQPATPIIPGLPYCNPAQEKYSIDMTKASQCFSDAWSGQLWSSGFNFTMCYPQASIVMKKVCEIMKADVESLNPKFHIQIQPLSRDYWNLAINHSLPVFHVGWLADFADPHDFAEGFMYSGMSGSFAPMQLYSNSTIDALVQQGINTMNETARRQTYYALQSVYHDDCPSVPTYQPLGRRFQRDWVQGWYFNPLLYGDYFYTEWKGGTPNPTRYSWSMFHHDPAHTGYTESPAPNTNQLRWNYTAGGWVESSPAVADGKVYVGSGDNKTYCLDAVTGALVWNYTTGGWVFSSPAVADGKVYVGSDDGRVYCLDAVTGAQVWNYTTGDHVRSSPAVVAGKVYVGSDDGKVYCLDAVTGAQVWNYTTGGWVFSSPAVVAGKVYVGSDDGNVYCLDAVTGAQVWNYTTGVWMFSSPAVADGKVYVGSDDGNVYCLDAVTGAQVWNYTTGDHVRSSPAVAGGKVYVGSDDGKVYCLDAVTGAQVWNYATGEGNYVFSSPAVADGKVYVGSLAGRVYCLDAVTGAQVWNYTTGDWVESSPAVADGVAYVGSEGGHVYAFGNVIRVPEDYGTVQEAINAASPGATIWIAPGIYNESLVINKTITLIGKPGSEPIFNGGGSGIAITIVSSGSGSTIAGITITSWDQGIIVQDACGCKIYDNIMSLMNNNGIVFQGTSAVNNQVYNNIFQQDAVAVDVTSSSYNNTISQNIIKFSTTGLKIDTNGNTICENMISNNQLGMSLVNSDNNTIYHNDFVDNTYAIQLSFTTSTGNKWDNGYPQGGNYWNNYNGADVKKGPNRDIPGSDGIGDTPYTIAVNNTDNYPLMKPFNEHSVGIANVVVKSVIFQGFTCNITVGVLNYGLYDETFNLAIWVNQTRITLQLVVLTNRSSTQRTFVWNTTGLPYGKYTIMSVIDTVPGETDTSDNAFTGFWVRVTGVGDLTGGTPNPYDFVPDGKVQIVDVSVVAKFFGQKVPLAPANCDVTGPTIGVPDGKIQIDDVATISKHFGQHYTY